MEDGTRGGRGGLFGFAPCGQAGWDTVLACLEARARGLGRVRPRGAEKLAPLVRLLEALGLQGRAAPGEASPGQAALGAAPQVVHVAGTVGKGLTCAMLARLLQAAPEEAGGPPGGTVGLFTSPHLLRLEERIQCGGQPLPYPVLAQAGQWVLRTEQRLGLALPFFDLLTAIALLAFRLHQVRWVVLETGLGGQGDATNALAAKACCVITRIGWDHQGVLGSSLQRIAGEKLGILRPGRPLVLAAQSPALERWLQARAAGLGARVLDARLLRPRRLGGRRSTRLRFPDGLQVCLPPPPPGSPWPGPAEAQLAPMRLECLANALTAAQACLQPADEPAWRRRATLQALGTPWRGRLELLRQQPTPAGILPLVLLDGAHNAPALSALLGQLKRWRLPPVQLLCAIARDKLTPPLRAPLGRLFAQAQQVWLPAQQHPRFATPQELRAYACPAARHTAPTPAGQPGPPHNPPAPLLRPQHSLEKALLAAAEHPRLPLVICGSLWLVGEVLAQLAQWQQP